MEDDVQDLMERVSKLESLLLDLIITVEKLDNSYGNSGYLIDQVRERIFANLDEDEIVRLIKRVQQ